MKIKAKNAAYSISNSFGTLITYPQLKSNDLLFTLNQVHGNNVINFNSLNIESNHQINADGFKVRIESNFNPSTPYPSIKTADCLPIVLGNQSSYYFLHVGWKGLKNKILNQVLSKESIEFAFIGPAINECCYQVSSDFVNEFPKKYQAKRFIKNNRFDLKSMAVSILNNYILRSNIFIATICTCCNVNLHSYRRDKDKNRNYNIFIPSKMLDGLTLVKKFGAPNGIIKEIHSNM